MSGTRIDMESIAGQNGFVKPSLMVVEENDNSTPQIAPTPEPSAVVEAKTSGSATVEIKEETMRDVMANPVDRPPSGRAVITDELPKRSSNGSAPRSSVGSTRLPPPGSSARKIADAIGEAMLSSQVEANNSNKRPASSKKRLPQGGGKPKTPPPSSRIKKEMSEEETRPEDGDDIDMLPRTPAEKHNYWKTRLQILKTSYRDVTIPLNADSLDWAELRKIYWIELDRVSLSKNVESYKLIMIVLFFIVEGVGARIFKVDITGFTVHSWRSMHRYERLLIELGEKNYSSFGENWPVEMRLAGLVLVNAIIFVLAKYIFKLTGQDASDEMYTLFNSLGSQTVETELPKGAGMDAPSPAGKGGDEGGLMGMLGSLLGGGGLGGLGALFGGGKGPAGGAAKPAQEDDGERIKPPTYAPRRRKKPAKTEEPPVVEVEA
jgi:hypothetical protein